MRVKAKSVLAAAVIGAVSVNIFCAMPDTAAQERPMAAVGSVIDYGLLVNKTHKLPDDYESNLPFSENNLIRQAFRFYMDLYGWGGLEGGVDCSLLTADVYRKGRTSS